MLFSNFFHNFVKYKLVILFYRLIFVFPIFNRVYFQNYKKLPMNPTPTPPHAYPFGVAGTSGGGGGADVSNWSKMLFLGTFWKITTY